MKKGHKPQFLKQSLDDEVGKMPHDKRGWGGREGAGSEGDENPAKIHTQALVTIKMDVRQ